MTYQPKRPPRIKQAEALARIDGQSVFALLMAMRTGKTKVVLDDWARAVGKGLVKDLLVIAPAGVYRTWRSAIEDDVADDLLAETRIFLWDSRQAQASNAKRLQNDFLNHPRNRILLINVEALSGVERARSLTLSFLQRGAAMAVIDESTAIKNPKAQRTKFINSRIAPLAKMRRILSGLPTPRSPLDLYTQFEFLDPAILGFGSFYSFRARYAVTRPIYIGARRIDTVIGYRNVEELAEKVAPYSFRCRLEDCYDMPPSDYSFRDVALTKDQQRIYEELRDSATAQLANGGHVTATQVIVQLLRMHQVLCGHTRDETGVIHEIAERRTEALLDTLDEYDGKAIVWCNYDIDVRKVAAALTKEYGEGSVARFWGGNLETREEEERVFKTAPACRFMVATAAAGRFGRTWDCADLVVYYSNSYDLDHRAQSEERAKNVNKKKSVAYVDLVARGTVDEKLIKALRNKINLASTITGDNYQEWLV